MTTEVKIDVRYPECDQMGIVHHAVYPIWYEIARMDFFAQIGFPFDAMKPLGVNPPMVNLNMNYYAPVRYPGTVTVRTQLKSFTPKKLELSYEVFYQDPEHPIASATSFHVWTGPDMKALDMQKCLPEAYAKLEAAHED